MKGYLKPTGMPYRVLELLMTGPKTTREIMRHLGKSKRTKDPRTGGSLKQSYYVGWPVTRARLSGVHHAVIYNYTQYGRDLNKVQPLPLAQYNRKTKKWRITEYGKEIFRWGWEKRSIILKNEDYYLDGGVE